MRRDKLRSDHSKVRIRRRCVIYIWIPVDSCERTYVKAVRDNLIDAVWDAIEPNERSHRQHPPIFQPLHTERPSETSLHPISAALPCKTKLRQSNRPRMNGAAHGKSPSSRSDAS